MPAVRRGGVDVGQQWRFSSLVSYTKAAPVQNTWYIAMPTISDTLLSYVKVEQDNAATSNRNIQVELLIDGNTITGTIANANNTQYYYVIVNDGADSLTIQVAASPVGVTHPVYARSARIRIRTTDAGIDNLNCTVRRWVL